MSEASSDPGAPVRSGSWLERFSLSGSPRQLALFRMVLGVHCFSVFASDALPFLAAIEARPHPLAATALPGMVEQVLQGQTILALRYVGLCASLAMAAGLFTRVSALLTALSFFATQHFWFRTTAFHDDWLYVTFYLLVLCAAPSGDVMSLDARFGRARPVRPVSAYRWPIEAVKSWFALVYLAAGISKLFPLVKGLRWLNGDSAREFAVEFVRDSPFVWWFGHTPFDYALRWPFAVSSWATVGLEIGAGVLFLTRRLDAPLYLALLGMHLSIWMLGIPGFVQIALATAAVWIPTEAYRELDARDAHPTGLTAGGSQAMKSGPRTS